MATQSKTPDGTTPDLPILLVVDADNQARDVWTPPRGVRYCGTREPPPLRFGSCRDGGTLA